MMKQHLISYIHSQNFVKLVSRNFEIPQKFRENIFFYYTYFNLASLAAGDPGTTKSTWMGSVGRPLPVSAPPTILKPQLACSFRCKITVKKIMKSITFTGYKQLFPPNFKVFIHTKVSFFWDQSQDMSSSGFPPKKQASDWLTYPLCVLVKHVTFSF